MLDPKMKIMSSLSEEIYVEGMQYVPICAFRIPIRAWYEATSPQDTGTQLVVSEEWNPLLTLLSH